MDVRRFRFALECTFKHLLRRDILAAIELDHPAVIKRVGVPRQHAFRAQARFSDGEIGAGARRDFRNLRILVYEDTKLIASFREPAPHKLLVSSLESTERGRFVLRGLAWR